MKLSTMFTRSTGRSLSIAAFMAFALTNTAVIWLRPSTALGAMAQQKADVSAPLHQGDVGIMPMVQPDGTYAVGVQVHGDAFADGQVIVRIFYRAKVKGLADELLRSWVSVVPVIDGAWAATDGVPVAKQDVVRIEVTVLKAVETQRFEVPAGSCRWAAHR